MLCCDAPFFMKRLNPCCHNADRHLAHFRHGLAYGGERGREQAGVGNVVEPNYRALLRNFDSSFAQGANRPERRHIVEGHERGEWTFSVDQFFS